jgi:hypothetical protein
VAFGAGRSARVEHPPLERPERSEIDLVTFEEAQESGDPAQPVG